MLSQAKTAESRRLLVDRVAKSRHISRSARLRDLLFYLTSRVLDGDVEEIHEQEVGHRVFGRSADYDTTNDNIVRVHASTLRKRLDQYFAEEGAAESEVIEIPKGNYAPVFRERPLTIELPELPSEPRIVPVRRTDWRHWLLAGIAILFAASTAFLLMRDPRSRLATVETNGHPMTALFWSRIFRPDHPADLVLDDAALALYQELTGRSVPLTGYFDRSYMRGLDDRDAAIVLRRQTSVSGANLLWKLSQLPGAGRPATLLRFARDYSFRELKADSAILIGTSHSNPWVEPFESKLGVRWVFDKTAGTYYPVDTWNGNKPFQALSADTPEGYAAISLLPNLGGTGNVLLIAGTGGSAINGGADFLADEQSLAALRKAIGGKDGPFPYFEALIKVKGRGALPRDAAVIVCRPPKG
jgi:hypothetical protein